MNDNRDCEHCTHHTEQGCSSWSCEFEPRMTDCEIGKMLIDKGIENGIQAYKQGRADEREKVLEEYKNLIIKNLNTLTLGNKTQAEYIRIHIEEWAEEMKGGAE